MKSNLKKFNENLLKSKFINNVIKGDSLEEMKLIPNNSVDMVLVDLPYGTTQNKWDSIIPLEQLWEQYHRIVKENGAMIFTSSGMFTAKLMLSNVKEYKYKYVWMKSKATNFLNAKKQPLRKHEDIVVFYKKQPTYNPQMSQGDAYSKGIRKTKLLVHMVILNQHWSKVQVVVIPLIYYISKLLNQRDQWFTQLKSP